MSNNLTDRALDELMDYVAQIRDNGSDNDIGSMLEQLLVTFQDEPEYSVDSNQLFQNISDRLDLNAGTLKYRRLIVWSAAAVLAALVFAGSLIFKRIGDNETGQGNSSAEIAYTRTTAPTDRPVLCLSDGRIIDLDSASAGLLAEDMGIEISVSGNEIYYEGTPMDDQGNVLKHKIITPKGRQYQVILPDSSRMWLNAASSVTYPVRFAREKREVELTGEAYFEVRKAKDWPFIVVTPKQEIVVLGTNFNVSAYDDEDQRTSLVKGSVQVFLVDPAHPSDHDGSKGTILRPGQQAVTAKGRSTIRVQAVDAESVAAWKDNLFVFNDEEVSDAMRKISRWYDVEVKYLDGMAGKRIGGSVPRYADIRELMDALSATGILTYELKGGMVTIMK